MEDIDHPIDKISSKDKSVYHGNNLQSLVLPVPCATIGPGELAISFDDCTEGALEALSLHFNVDHLSECTDNELLKYPIAGIIHGIGNRFVVPLKVRTTPKSKPRIVYFVVDSGAPVTSLGARTAEILFGNREFDTVFIQDAPVRCRHSGKSNELMKDVNLLGSQFLFKANISIMVSPHPLQFPYEDERVFYLAPFSMISEAQTMAASRQQSVDVSKKLEVHVVNTLSRSDPTENQRKMAEKVYLLSEKPDESLNSTSVTSESNQQMPSHHGSNMDLN